MKGMVRDVFKRKLKELGQSAPVPTPPEKPGRKPKAGSKNSERKKELTKADTIAGLKVKVADMLDRAKADPSSDATAIIRILLLNEMTNEKLGFREEAYSKQVEAERKQAELQNRFEHERFLRLQEARKWRGLPEKLGGMAMEAEARGESLSHEEIFKQISAVIGVGQPQIELVNPKGPEGSGSENLR